MRGPAAIKIVLLLWAIGSSCPAVAYKNVAALLLLRHNVQHDTIGFNLVSECNRLFYQLIAEERISLYTAPGSSTVVSPMDLQVMERNAGIAFTASQELFIYESWSSNRRETNFGLVGFSVIGQGLERVNFGWISAEEVMPYLRNSLITVNRNGSPGTTFLQAYLSRRYVYQLVQFGAEDFNATPLRGFEINREAFQSSKKVKNRFEIPHVKELTFRVTYRHYTTDLDESKKLFESLTIFFRNNPEFVLNHCKMADSSRRKIKFPLSPDLVKLETNERWVAGDRDTVKMPETLRVYDRNLGEISFSMNDLRPYKVYVGFEAAETFITRRQYPYRLVSLNDSAVKSHEQDNILEALNRYFWPQLTVYATAK